MSLRYVSGVGVSNFTGCKRKVGKTVLRYFVWCVCFYLIDFYLIDF